jgi:putative colanic acid biosynthesis glycosyltransferase
VNILKILSVNIRATQGGAGRMAYDLHSRLRELGVTSQLLYGYASGIKADPKVAGDASVRWLGARSTIIANYIAHLSIGRELAVAGKRILSAAVSEADVIHLHALHHYYLSWNAFTEIIMDSRKPVVVTAHDWWLLSGRCGFVRDCTAWRRECGECGKRRFEDLPSLFDRSRQVREDRQRSLRKMADRLVVVCPSQHLMRNHCEIYPDLDIRFVPNALDREFEHILLAQPNLLEREGYMFCASDLNSPGKIDSQLVRLLEREFGPAVKLVGRASPFKDTSATDFGEVRSRSELVRIYSTTRSLVFTSQMDNAPLTIIEALSCGTYVIAYPSPAAEEMLSLVGGRCVTSQEEALEIIRAGEEATLYGGQSHNDLSVRSRNVWSGRSMVEKYLAIYDQVLK